MTILEFDIFTSSPTISFEYQMGNSDILTFDLEWINRFGYYLCSIRRDNQLIVSSRALNQDVNVLFGVEGYYGEEIYPLTQPQLGSSEPLRIRYVL